jgi:hypothetical protein
VKLRLDGEVFWQGEEYGLQASLGLGLKARRKGVAEGSE